MCWWRSNPLGRVIALSLLLWTAIDLANASACALDNEDSTPYGATTAGIQTDTGAGTAGSTAHVDDCFCCSHCVDVERLAAPVDIARTPRPVTLFSQGPPSLLASPFYHPPQSSLL